MIEKLAKEALRTLLCCLLNMAVDMMLGSGPYHAKSSHATA